MWGRRGRGSGSADTDRVDGVDDVDDVDDMDGVDGVDGEEHPNPEAAHEQFSFDLFPPISKFILTL